MVHFIEVAEQCRILNNFNASMEILSGLGDSSIHRLKNHWTELPKKSQQIYNDLKAILNSDRAFASFRAYLKNAEQPCIPYLGMYLTDLTFIEDGNPDKVGDLPNFFKRRLIANVIAEIQQYQQTPYQLEEAASIKKFLLGVDLLDKEIAYQRSLLIVPRGGVAQSNVVLPPISRQSSLNNNANQSSGGNNNSGGGGGGDDEEEFGEFEVVLDYPYYDRDSNANIRCEKNNDILSTPTIICATLPKIIERLSYPKFPQDTQLLDNFLLNYRSYATGKQLIDLLIHRINMPLPKNPQQRERFIKTKLVSIQARVMNIFKSWCEKYTFDFMIDKELYETFSEFAANPPASKDLIQRINATLQQNIKAIKSQNVVKNCQPSKSIPPLYPIRRGANINNPKFLDFHHEEIARALSLFDFDLFYRIMPQELISQNYLNSKSKSPFLYQFIKRSKTIENWVIYEIALFPHENIEQRKEILTHIINIAKSCENMQNYHTVIAIVNGLQSSEVKSLLQTWDSLTPRVYEKFNQISQVSKKTLADYKQLNKSDPAIPPVSLYLHQIKLIDEKENDNIESMMNVKKKSQIQEIVTELFRFKSFNYSYETYSWLQNYVKYGIEKHAEDDPYEEIDKNPLLCDIGILILFIFFLFN